MIVVAHNMAAMNADRQLKIVTGQKSKSAEKLSSGYRINRAADDAAGLAISEKMRYQIRGLDRASLNIQDGVSLVQVADGALNEDHAVLQRMRELSVQAANDTNTLSDRQHIQSEIDQLANEIDRTANATNFNQDIYPLLGGELSGTRQVWPTKKVKVTIGDVDIPPKVNTDPTDPTLSVTWTPFGLYDETNGTFKNDYYKDFNFLKLQASVKEGNEVKTCDLLYDRASSPTSQSRIRLYDANLFQIGSSKVFKDIPAQNFKFINYTKNSDKDWSRTFEAKTSDGKLGASITQNVKISADNMSYEISYDVKSIGTELTSFEFMMNMDTSYGGDHNGDGIEGYYTRGREIDKYSIYVPENTGSLVENNNFFVNQTLSGNTSNAIHKTDFPNSIAIKNRSTENIFPFTEKISFDDSWKPVVSIGAFGTTSNTWDYFSDTRTAENGGLGEDLTGRYEDKTTTLIWSLGDTISTLAALGQGRSFNFKFNYGIEDTRTNQDIPDSIRPTVEKEIEVPDYSQPPMTVEVHRPTELNIQAGALSGQVIKVSLVNATAKALGIKDPAIDVTSHAACNDAMTRLENAIEKVSTYRSTFGAQQNRLEAAAKLDDNTSENTQAAESRIRDTDMAKEMTFYSMQSILQQAGQSMLAQTNQMNQGVLELLR